MHSRRAGYTFLEVLLVIGILSMLMAIAFPKMKGAFHRGEIESAARELTATLRYARHAAIMRGDGAEVRFDPETGRFKMNPIRLDEDGNPAGMDSSVGGGKDGKGFKVTADARGIKTLPDSVFFTLIHSTAPLTDNSDMPRIIFYPDGSATAGKIGIQNERGKALNVNIFRTTGMAMVRPGNPVMPADVRPLFYLAGKVTLN